MTFKSATANPQTPGVEDIVVEELKENMLLVHLIDVRTAEEFVGELGHVPGAQLFELDSLSTKINELPKDGTIVFLCRSGARSGRAAALAQVNGFNHVYNMAGGMLRWNQIGYPVEK